MRVTPPHRRGSSCNNASLRLGVIRAYLKSTTLTTPTVGAGVTLGGRYGLAASIEYGTNDGVTTIASMMGLYVRF